jgi:hypothetical protein
MPRRIQQLSQNFRSFPEQFTNRVEPTPLASVTAELFFSRTCLSLSRRVELAQAFLDKLKHVPQSF